MTPESETPVWMPIETAPKDGSRRIMIATISGGEIRDIDYDAVYEMEQESWELPAPYWVWKSAHGRVEYPTHWAPLPAVPVETGDVLMLFKVEAVSDDLHALDLQVPGLYGIRMDAGARPRAPLQEGDDPLQEAALDKFHDTVAIEVLDDFEITVERLASEAAAPGEVRWL